MFLITIVPWNDVQISQIIISQQIFLTQNRCTKYQNYILIILSMQTSPEILISIDTDISRTFKMNIQEIQQTFKSISGVTNNLDNKICVILQKHQKQFFEVYKMHMLRIQKQIKSLEETLAEKQKLLVQGEDIGSVAKLTKKIKQLERELTATYNKIEDKDKNILTLKMQLNLAKKEIQHLQNRIKEGMKQTLIKKLEEREGRYIKSQTSSLDVTRNVSEENLFATEIKTRVNSKVSNKGDSKVQASSIQPSPNLQLPTPKQKELELVKLKLSSEIKKLTKANKQLLKVNVQIMGQHSQNEQFFIQCVQETKKLVSSRIGHPLHKISTLQFNKQDKMNVLMLMLTNDQIVSTVYSMLFQRNSSPLESIFIPTVRNKTRKNSIKKQYRSSQKPQIRNSSFELRLPSIPKTNNSHLGTRLLKRKQNLNYNDFL